MLGLLVWVGCAKKPWTAPISELEHGLEVVVKKAYVQGDDTLEVQTTVVNKGEKSIRIDRQFWALELPDGQTLRHGGTSNITIAPGGASDVNVSFGVENEGFKSITSATLVVGGVYVGDDPSPYPAGEIPLRQGTTPAASSTAEPEPAPSATGETAPSAAPEPKKEPAPEPKKKEGPTTLVPEPDE